MILITGASGGIGKELIKHFSLHDIVYGTYYSRKPDVCVDNCSKVDISDYSQVINWVSSLKLKNVTLINCAGINYNSFAHRSDIDKWKEVIDVNLIGTFNVIRSVLPIMRDQKYGRIINISSVLADKGMIGTSAYSASKSALKGLIKAISLENALCNITINNIELGYSKFGMIEQIPYRKMSAIIDTIPSKKLCSIVDIVNTIEYLMNTTYINGTSIKLNGGLI